MSQQELLKIVISGLEDKNIPYMLTGSLVSSIQGEPRLTHDIDIIISLENKDSDKIVSLFPPDRYYISENAIKESLDKKTSFNVIDLKAGDKVDFWILTGNAFDSSRFARRIKIKFLDFFIYISTPEDTILEKLLWSKISGGSEKHFVDAVHVFEIQREELDYGYIKLWSEKLGIEIHWKKIIGKAAK